MANPPGRVKRKLAKRLLIGLKMHEPGDDVWLRPDQVERLEANGTLAPKARRKV